MQRPSHNPSNYYLTQDGVISKIDTYWDKLREASEELEAMSRYTFRRLVNVFAGSAMGILPVLWLAPTKALGMFILVGVLIISMLLVGIQFVILYEFHALRKRNNVLYEALRIEVSREYFEEEDIPLEERILLHQYALCSRFPIHSALYSFLLFLLVCINSSFLYLYHIYWK
jgi:hypothetical protein